MKDQLIILMEALRLSQLELEKFRRRKQNVENTVFAVERILYEPQVMAAISNLEPLVPSPSLAPELEERVDA
jgi:hypothetical protein